MSAAHCPEASTLAHMRPRVLRWYRAKRRDLPWRRTRDPYRIWVSEIMLQQTRVDVVVPYYEAFVQRFPNVQTLAAARLDSILRAWSGLGYYRRARHMHAAAKRIVERHGGRLPRDVDAVRALPGIGDYTAGAICSIAFGKPAPILDGNVVRVLARWFGIAEDVDSRAVRNRLWEWAAHWARTRSPGDANQALMELGATLCTKTAPACSACPVREHCNAFATGRTQDLPRPRKRPDAVRVQAVALLVRRADALLLVRRRSGRLLQDWWEAPTQRAPHPQRAAPPTAARLQRWADTMQARLGMEVERLRAVGMTRHGILANRIELEVVTAAWKRHAPGTKRAKTPPARPGPSVAGATPLVNLELADLEVRWVEPDACRGLPLSTLTRKALRTAASTDSSWSEYLDQDIREQRPDQGRAQPTQ